MIVHGLFVSSSCSLISVCIFIVSISLVISRATVIFPCRGGGGYLVEPLYYSVIYLHCRVLCFYPCCVDVFCMFAVM